MATHLFVARGFDTVTLDEIAAAAKVSKMTVFNYFARKEDLMLDRQDHLLLLPFREALRARANDEAPIDALRSHADRLREQKHPFLRIDPSSLEWWRTVAASPSLKARIRELQEEAAEGLALELGALKPDGLARLLAGVIVLTVRSAREEGVRMLERGGTAKKANASLQALIDRGLAAVQAIAFDENGETRRPGRPAGEPVPMLGPRE